MNKRGWVYIYTKYTVITFLYIAGFSFVYVVQYVKDGLDHDGLVVGDDWWLIC